MKKLLLASMALCLTIAACKKDGGGGTTTPPSRQDTLTSGKWRLVAVNARATIGTVDSTYNIYPFIDTCDRDNYVIFNKDGSVTNDAGPQKCATTDPQTSPGGTWKLNGGNDTLTMQGGTLPGTFKLSVFTNSNMELKNDTTIFGIKGKLTANFVHE
jgi:hypothetical protein